MTSIVQFRNGLVPLVLPGQAPYENDNVALLALACSATAWAGNDILPANPRPDASSSLLLLSMGVAAVGVVRRAFRR